jgi:Ran GTPase-activating protein (RanGAP) involved in mRNA processing and transport
MGRILDREIMANIQAVSYVSHNREQGGTKYELIDKGPDFMRCAIKMAQIHKILHLSLPDNMLALEDSRMIADLIKKNTPLRKLNLSTNQLDADCAALIANSLIYNKNLQLLDVSHNLLGDFGVYLLLTPLVRKHL